MHGQAQDKMFEIALLVDSKAEKPSPRNLLNANVHTEACTLCVTLKCTCYSPNVKVI